MGIEMACQRKSPSAKDVEGAVGHFSFLEGMAMRNLMWGALAVGLILTAGSAAWADDTVRTGGPAADDAIQGGTDTWLVHGRGHGGYGRGFYGGGHYGGGHYGGGYGRGYYGGGYGRSFYGGGYYNYSPYYASYGYGRSYYYPRSYYSYYSSYYPTDYPSYCYQPTYYYPIGGAIAPPATLPSSYLLPGPQNYVPPMPPAQGDGPYSYDGDPRNVVPMPGQPQANPAAPRSVPTDGRLVSLPQPTGTTAAPRVSYPAYGEDR